MPIHVRVRAICREMLVCDNVIVSLQALGLDETVISEPFMPNQVDVQFNHIHLRNLPILRKYLFS